MRDFMKCTFEINGEEYKALLTPTAMLDFIIDNVVCDGSTVKLVDSYVTNRDWILADDDFEDSYKIEIIADMYEVPLIKGQKVSELEKRLKILGILPIS